MPDPAAPAQETRRRSFLAASTRTWRLTVPIHVLAFAFLYFATDRLLQREVVSMASMMASELLSEEADDVRVLARVHSPNLEQGHLFDALQGAHGDIEFRLFLASGGAIGPDTPTTESERMEIAEFLSSGDAQRFRLRSAGGHHEVRGWERIVADGACASCHRPGQTLAIAAMTMDLSQQIARARAGSRRNLALLILVWALALGGSTVLVQRSVRRAAQRFEAELAAAEAGHGEPQSPAGGPVLDPVSAELHDSLRRFLRRQRAREAEVASRLAHTDRLASLGQLAAGLAHEIKNPLAGVQGALEILSQDLEKASDRELCGEMLGELKRVDETMRSLLSSAKPSPPQRRPTDMLQLLTDLQRLLEPGLRQRQVKLTVEAAAGGVTARVDPAKIRQVLINLIGNAADAMTGGGEITLRAGLFPAGGGAILAVRDDGPGIPDEVAQKIFEPFFTTKFSGTGLGLAIARSLVEQHGGTLEFETEKGQGTTFFVVLPDRDDDASDESAGDG